MGNSSLDFWNFLEFGGNISDSSLVEFVSVELVDVEEGAGSRSLIIDQLCGTLSLNDHGFPVIGEYLSAFRAINFMDS